MNECRIVCCILLLFLGLILIISVCTVHYSGVEQSTIRRDGMERTDGFFFEFFPFLYIFLMKILNLPIYASMWATSFVL